jgi:hypothetical protein
MKAEGSRRGRRGAATYPTFGTPFGEREHLRCTEVATLRERFANAPTVGTAYPLVGRRQKEISNARRHGNWASEGESWASEGEVWAFNLDVPVSPLICSLHKILTNRHELRTEEGKKRGIGHWGASRVRGFPPLSGLAWLGKGLGFFLCPLPLALCPCLRVSVSALCHIPFAFLYHYLWQIVGGIVVQI